jgi:hypothetical protein
MVKYIARERFVKRFLMRYTANTHEARDNLAAFDHRRIVRGGWCADWRVDPLDKPKQHLPRDRNAGNS